MTLCKTPELATEVTLQPLERFSLDAAILFSDILTIPDAMGLGLYFSEGEGPRFEHPVHKKSDIENLAIPDMHDDLGYVMEAVKLIRNELDGRVPLIGFSGSPWTLATYMVEGGSSKEFAKVKGLLYEQPTMMHQLLDVLSEAVTGYLNAQINAGAQAVMIFDTWGGVLTTRDYQQFSLAYMEKIISGLIRHHEDRKIPIIMFSKGGCQWLEDQAAVGADALGLDWTLDIGRARDRVGNMVALQGNMDPCVLYSSPERIREEVAFILSSYGKGSGHVFNLGHGIHQHVDPERAKTFIDAVHELSPAYHQ
jgi:uroporphyrinogen decarboxylase